MAEESQQERTEQATAKRREDFRKKGQVAQSKEIHTAALMSSALLLWYFYGSTFWDKLSFFITDYWRHAGEITLTPLSTIAIAVVTVKKMALLLAPFFLLVLVVGFFSSFLQIGWNFTTKPLEPDFAKLDPINGMKKFFSRRSMVEVVKSMSKVGVVGVVAYFTVADHFEGSLALARLDLVETIRFLAKVSFQIMIRTCGILIILGVLDFLFVRWEMDEKMKMTKQETKEEFKETEGDPHVKSRIRSIQYQMARKRMMAEVPKADVVITNPTHISVALSYQRGEMDAPMVVAKGADLVAMKIREIAREHNVPIVENVGVARALHKVDIGAYVPEELFKAVAEILAYVYKLRGRRG